MCWLSTSVPSQSKMINFNDLARAFGFIPAIVPAINVGLRMGNHPQKYGSF
jgi:hypothetical protein